jgi:hypothetical protein
MKTLTKADYMTRQGGNLTARLAIRGGNTGSLKPIVVIMYNRNNLIQLTIHFCVQSMKKNCDESARTCKIKCSCKIKLSTFITQLLIFQL